MKRFAITVLGKDRPGIVAEVARILYEEGGNIEDSSMTILEGEFAMILIVALDRSEEELMRAFSPLETMGLRVFVKPLSDEEQVREEIPGATSYTISIFGGDRPGIVYGITSLLAREGINITDMETKVLEGEKGPLYAMVLEADVPGHVDMERLERDLRSRARELGVDVSIHPIKRYSL